MTYINKKQRAFRHVKDTRCELMPRRSEGRIKRYTSADDVRAWCYNVEDRRQHILELLLRGKPASLGIIPLNDLLAAFNKQQTNDLKRLKCLSTQLMDMLDKKKAKSVDNDRLEDLKDFFDDIATPKYPRRPSCKCRDRKKRIRDKLLEERKKRDSDDDRGGGSLGRNLGDGGRGSKDDTGRGRGDDQEPDIGDQVSDKNPRTYDEKGRRAKGEPFVVSRAQGPARVTTRIKLAKKPDGDDITVDRSDPRRIVVRVPTGQSKSLPPDSGGRDKEDGDAADKDAALDTGSGRHNGSHSLPPSGSRDDATCSHAKRWLCSTYPEDKKGRRKPCAESEKKRDKGKGKDSASSDDETLASGSRAGKKRGGKAGKGDDEEDSSSKSRKAKTGKGKGVDISEPSIKSGRGRRGDDEESLAVGPKGKPRGGDGEGKRKKRDNEVSSKSSGRGGKDAAAVKREGADDDTTAPPSSRSKTPVSGAPADDYSTSDPQGGSRKAPEARRSETGGDAAGKSGRGARDGPGGKDGSGGKTGPGSRGELASKSGPGGRDEPSSKGKPGGRDELGGKGGLGGRDEPSSKGKTSGRDGPGGKDEIGGRGGPGGRDEIGGKGGPGGRDEPDSRGEFSGKSASGEKDESRSRSRPSGRDEYGGGRGGPGSREGPGGDLVRRLDDANKMIDNLKAQAACNITCSRELEDLEKEIEDMRQGKITPERLLKKHIELIRKCCAMMGKSNVFRGDEGPPKAGRGPGERQLEEMQNRVASIDALNTEKDMLAEKVKNLERELKQYKELPGKLGDYQEKCDLLSACLLERDKLLEELKRLRDGMGDVDSLKEEARRASDLEKQLRLKDREHRMSLVEVGKARSQMGEMGDALGEMRREKDMLVEQLKAMQLEFGRMRDQAKENEMLRLEKENLEGKLKNVANMQGDYSDLIEKAKDYDKLKNERDLYKSKYDELVKIECHCDMLRAQLEAAKGMGKERDVLARKMSELQECLCEKERELIAARETVDSLRKASAETKEKLEREMATVRGELERKEGQLADSCERLSLIESGLKDANSDSDNSSLRQKINSLETELAQTKVCLTQKTSQLRYLQSSKDRDSSYADCDAVIKIKRELDAAKAENKKLQEIANKMISITGDEHVQQMLKQSECAVKRVVEELGKQYQQWDMLKKRGPPGGKRRPGMGPARPDYERSFSQGPPIKGECSFMMTHLNQFKEKVDQLEVENAKLRSNVDNQTGQKSNGNYLQQEMDEIIAQKEKLEKQLRTEISKRSFLENKIKDNDFKQCNCE